MYTVWNVDKYKITFKLVTNHWTNEILFTDISYEGWNFNSGNYLFTTDTK